MDVKIDGNRVRTTGAYDPRITRALVKLEGMKRWGANRSFSFENTPFNLEIWRQVFPDAKVEGLGAAEMCDAGAAVVEGGLFTEGIGRPTFHFKTPPRAHQKAALEKLGNKRLGALFMEVGTGKSWTAIAMLGQRWCNGSIDQAIILVRKAVCHQWHKEQFPAHMSPAVDYRSLVLKYGTKTAEREFESLMQFAGLRILIINIESLATDKTQKALMKFIAGQGSKTMICIDESQDIANSSSNRSAAAIKLGKLVQHKLIMTGTPIFKNLLNFFPQFQFLDEGIIGHRYITTFKNRYCEFKKTDYGDIITGYRNEAELYSKIDQFSFRVTTAEAYDLPPKNYVVKRFDLSDEQRSAMKELKDNFFLEFSKDEKLFVKNAASLLMRLQQISCGFLPMEDGTLRTFKNPRFDELKRLIDQRSGKIIIWCRFHEDIELLRGAIDNSVAYYGKIDQLQRQRAISSFMDKHSGTDILIATAASAGTGLNLQGLCQTNIYYSNTFSALDRWQSEGRTWRDGTTLPVTYFDLVANKSPDSKILSNLKAKRDLSDLFLDDLRKMFELEDE